MTGRHGRGTLTGPAPAVVRDVQVGVATVEVTDDCEVELHQLKRRMSYSPEEAIELADALRAAAQEAQTALEEDVNMWAASVQAGLAHAFDVAPSCRDCSEGKHGACIGSAFVESADGVDEVDCGCAKAEHRVIGAGS